LPKAKLRIAEKLDELGVNAIEAGFAAASKGELEAIRDVARAGLKAEIYSMARGVRADIDAVLKTEAKYVHLVIPTSELHIRNRLKKTPDEVVKIAEDIVQYAKSHGIVVELSAEDASRSDLGFMKRFFEAGIAAGAERLCACDTVGILTPERSFHLFSELSKSFRVPISVHCHDDFGMAVTNSVEGIKGGASQVHVTVNGLGERAGNAALEEVVMSLKFLYKAKVSIKTELLWGLSQLVSRLTGISVPPNKAIVGDNAFTHESGMHIHGILSDPMTYEPISPELVGVRRRFVIGKHTGRHSIKASLESIGLKPNEDQLGDIFDRVKALGDKGKRITDADLQAIAEAVMGIPARRKMHLEELIVVTGNRVTPTASIKLKVGKREVSGAATGLGPVDAAMNAVKRAMASIEPMKLEDYYVKSITGGTDAVVEVTVRLRKGDKIATATGVREDIVMASIEAMLSCVNVLIADYK